MQEEIARQRENKICSPYRDRPVEENLRLFEACHSLLPLFLAATVRLWLPPYVLLHLALLITFVSAPVSARCGTVAVGVIPESPLPA